MPATAAAAVSDVSSGFGARVDPIDARRAMHSGLDMPGRKGTPVLAAANGVVRSAGRRGGYGNMIEIAHAGGAATRYAHLSRILIRTGEEVVQGQLIGHMGSTGRSTGSHLHFEYRLDGIAVDPTPYFGRALGLSYRTRIEPAPSPAMPHRSRFSLARDAVRPNGSALPGGGQALRAQAP